MLPPESRLVTDEHEVYAQMKQHFDHQTVRHGDGEYGRDDVHTNSMEGVWALMKRQIYDIHHWVSQKHLSRYLGEMTRRFNRRGVDEGPRVNEFLARIDGRLRYRELIG